MNKTDADNPRAALIDPMRRLLSPLEPIPTGVSPRVDPIPGIRAVVFDVYGTMVISGSGDVGTAAATNTAEALDAALRAVDLNPLTAQTTPRGIALLEQCIGADHQAGRAEGIAHPEVDIRRIWAQVVEALRAESLLAPPGTCISYERLAVEYECRVNPTWPMPGLGQVLHALGDRGLSLGIVSNSQFYTPLLFEALLEASLDGLGFDPQLCAWSYVARRAKPDAALYRPVARVLASRGIAPETVLYVGNDMRNDTRPAAQMGWRTVLFAGDRRSLRLREDMAELADVQPDAVITHLNQLLTLTD